MKIKVYLSWVSVEVAKKGRVVHKENLFSYLYRFFETPLTHVTFVSTVKLKDCPKRQGWFPLPTNQDWWA